MHFYLILKLPQILDMSDLYKCLWLFVYRGSRVRQLWGYIYPTLATRRDWTLSVQCLWPILQDEWAEQASYQAKATAGESHNT